MTTGTVIVTDALIGLGVVSQAGAATATQLAVGLRWFNRMMDSFANVRALLYTTATETFTFVASQAAYTTAVLASGARPVALNYMNVTLSGVNYPCRLIVNQSFADIGYPPATGIPEVCYYDAAFPTGTMTFWPIPYSSSLTCNVYTQRVLTGTIAAATDRISSGRFSGCAAVCGSEERGEGGSARTQGHELYASRFKHWMVAEWSISANTMATAVVIFQGAY